MFWPEPLPRLVRSEDEEVREIVTAFRRSTRAIEYPKPEWYWKDLERHEAFVRRLHKMVTAPADKQVPVEDALEPAIGIATLILSRYGPMPSKLSSVLHVERVVRPTMWTEVNGRPNQRSA